MTFTPNKIIKLLWPTSATMKANVFIPEWHPTTTQINRQKVARVRIMPRSPKSRTCVLRGVVAEKDNWKKRKKNTRWVNSFCSVHNLWILQWENVSSKVYQAPGYHHFYTYSICVIFSLCKLFFFKINLPQSCKEWSMWAWCLVFSWLQIYFIIHLSLIPVVHQL